VDAQGTNAKRSQAAVRGRKSSKATPLTKSGSTTKFQAAKGFFIKTTDLDFELPEPKNSELDNNDLAVNVILHPVEPNRKLIGRNPFVSPEYWLSKGYKMQTGRSSNENLNRQLDIKNGNQFGIRAKPKVLD